MADAKSDSVSFIIPHRGRIDMLAATLASIEDLDKSGFDVDVFVVTQESLDTVKPDLEAYDIVLQVFAQPLTLTISELRNYGVAQSNSTYLAFLDADIALSANWLQAMRDTLKESSGRTRVISSAYQQASYSASYLEKIRVKLSNLTVDDELVFLPGRNLFLTRDTFEKVGGFPAHLATCEDYYFTEKASGLGALFYTSSASYVHLGEDKRHKELFYKEVWRAQSNLQSVKGRSVPLSEWPSFVVPFAVAFFLVLTLVFTLFFNFSMAVLCLLVSAIPVFLYGLRLKLKPAHSSDECLPLLRIFQFYGVYFPARALGSLIGLGHVLKWKG